MRRQHLAGPGALLREPDNSRDRLQFMSEGLSHLDRLEAESLHIIREVAAECDNPVMLYSIGKDSCLMLHLAVKAFHPAPPPFPLTGAIESTATTLQDIVAEMIAARTSERGGRLIDRQFASSMERKKREGYF